MPTHEINAQQFATLRHRAVVLLTTNPNVPKSEVQFCLLFCIQPWFISHTSWTIFTNPEGHYRVYRKVWDAPFDAERFNNPLTGLKHGLNTKPTIHENWLSPLSSETCQALYQLINSIPATNALREAQKIIQIDGERWFLRLMNEEEHVDFEIVPDTLQERTAETWLMTLKELLESLG